MALSTNQMLEASQPIVEEAHINNLKTNLIDSTASRIVLGSTFERYANPIAIPPITTTRILLLRIPNSGFKILTKFSKIEIFSLVQFEIFQIFYLSMCAKNRLRKHLTSRTSWTKLYSGHRRTLLKRRLLKLQAYRWKDMSLNKASTDLSYRASQHFNQESLMSVQKIANGEDRQWRRSYECIWEFQMVMRSLSIWITLFIIGKHSITTCHAKSNYQSQPR